jgi:hypothetical protein
MDMPTYDWPLHVLNATYGKLGYPEHCRAQRDEGDDGGETERDVGVRQRSPCLPVNKTRGCDRSDEHPGWLRSSGSVRRWNSLHRDITAIIGIPTQNANKLTPVPITTGMAVAAGVAGWSVWRASGQRRRT